MLGQMLLRTGAMRRAGRAAAQLRRLTWPRSPMSSTGTTTSISSGLRMPASTIVTGRGSPGADRSRRGSGRSPRAGAGWPTARCAAAAGSVIASSRSSESARWAPRLVGGQRVDLVDDHRLDADQRLAGRRREHQVEALGRGDQQVGRAADERLPVARRGVSPVRIADRRRGERHARGARPPARCRPAGRAGSSRRRRPGPAAARCRAPGCGGPSSGGGVRDQPVDRREEGGERLAAARSARRSACARPRRWPASPAPGPASARGTTWRTTPARRARTARARDDRPWRHATEGVSQGSPAAEVVTRSTRIPGRSVPASEGVTLRPGSPSDRGTCAAAPRVEAALRWRRRRRPRRPTGERPRPRGGRRPGPSTAPAGHEGPGRRRGSARPGGRR